MRLRKPKVIVITLSLCLSILDIESAFQASRAKEYLAPVSRLSSPSDFYSFQGIKSPFSPTKILPNAASLKSLEESLGLADSGFFRQNTPFGEISFRSRTLFEDQYRVQIDLNKNKGLITLSLTRKLPEKKGRPPGATTRRLQLPRTDNLVKEGDLLFAKMDPKNDCCRLYFTDRVLVITSFFRTFVAITSSKDPLVGLFKRQMFEERKETFYTKENRYWFVGDIYDSYRFLVVEGEDNKILGIFYLDKEDPTKIVFKQLQLKPNLTINMIRYLLAPLPNLPWLFLETVRGFSQFFFQNYPLRVLSETEIFKSSGLELVKENVHRLLGKAKAYGSEYLQEILLLYLFPGLRIEIFHGENADISVENLKSVRVFPEEGALEVVTYRDKALKNLERLDQPRENKLMRRYYQEGKLLWQYQFKDLETFFEVVAKWQNPLLSRNLQELKFADPKQISFLGDKRSIEFVLFQDGDELKVLDFNGQGIGAVNLTEAINILRTKGAWVIESGLTQTTLSYEGEIPRTKTTRRIKPPELSLTPIPGLQGEAWKDREEPLTETVPQFVHTSPSKRIVVYEYGDSWEIFGLKENGDVRFNVELPKQEVSDLQYVPETQTIRLEVLKDGSQEIKEINEKGLFQHRISDDSRLLEILKSVAVKMGPALSLEANDEFDSALGFLGDVRISLSGPDEFKLGLWEKVKSLLGKGVLASNLTFYGVYHDNFRHAPSDLTMLWGDVLFATVQEGKEALVFNAHGEKLGLVENWNSETAKMFKDESGDIWLQLESDKGEIFLNQREELPVIHVRGEKRVMRPTREQGQFGPNRPKLKIVDKRSPEMVFLPGAQATTTSL